MPLARSAASPLSAVPDGWEHHDLAAQREELVRAVGTNQLRLHYQPVVDLRSGCPVGVEALVRWEHPTRGLLGPDAFMPLAERTGLDVPIGAWVIGESCRLAALLQHRPGAPTVAVNLSGGQLSHRGLVALVRDALQAHGCRGDSLVFEVTETALVTDMDAAAASVNELRALGSGVAIDDFGTGYSSMLYLKHLSPSALKVDRSFVRGMTAGSFDTAVVAALVSLSHNLGLQCVAEGVETTQQLELLGQLGCDLAQGYLLCEPLDVDALVTWLDAHESGDPQRASEPVACRETARIVAMHDNGLSPHTIAAALNAERNRTDSGRRWSSQSVALVLLRSRGVGSPTPR
ncbi:MAG TPA: EAL domain-containing protein [Mycobacteriales bacterium]|nr:EAL domain-containing protein [Mycobacteriales bacterium]